MGHRIWIKSGQEGMAMLVSRDSEAGSQGLSYGNPCGWTQTLDIGRQRLGTTFSEELRHLTDSYESI